MNNQSQKMFAYTYDEELLKPTETDIANARKYKIQYAGYYRCTLCERNVAIDESFSHHGYNLICEPCRFKLMHLLGVHNIIDIIQKVGVEKENK